MAATKEQRSLLDPLPRGRRRLGVIPGLEAARDVEGDDAAEPGTLRAYRAQMRREFPGQPCPTPASIICGAFGFARAQDDGVASRFSRILQRTGVEIVGVQGGFAVQPAIADQIWDASRATEGPWSYAHWLPCTTLETWLPITFESSRATGSRWGGISATWGYDETVLPPPVDGKIGRANFKMERLLIQLQPQSRDLFSDQSRVQHWLSYVGQAEIRMAIESAMISGKGTGAGNGAIGVINSPASAITNRQTTNEITAQDIDTMFSSIYAPCQKHVFWHCSSTTLEMIDSIAASGAWPRNYYSPPGTDLRFPDYPTVKGRPVITLEVSPQLGQPGDLVAVAWNQFAWCYRKMSPTDSPLSFGFRPAAGPNATGNVGLPPDAVEIRMSDEVFFSTDQLSLVFKFRGSFNTLWPVTGKSPNVADPNGNQTGPAAILV